MELGSKSRLMKMNKNERNRMFCFNMAFLFLLHVRCGNPQNKDVWLLLNFCLKLIVRTATQQYRHRESGSCALSEMGQGVLHFAIHFESWKRLHVIVSYTMQASFSRKSTQQSSLLLERSHRACAGQAVVVLRETELAPN